MGWDKMTVGHCSYAAENGPSMRIELGGDGYVKHACSRVDCLNGTPPHDTGGHVALERIFMICAQL